MIVSRGVSRPHPSSRGSIAKSFVAAFISGQPGAGGLGMRAKRPKRSRLRSVLFLFPAWFGPSSSFRVGFHKARGVLIGRNVEIGYFVIIDNLYPERVTIEDDVTVSARTTILSHDESKAYTGRGDELIAQTTIRRGAFIGVHCVVMPGVTVGERSVVGAGSVVTRDVPPGSTVIGVPARVI